MTDQPNTEAAAEEAQGPQFSLQRIYVRDLSFEAPKSPAIFRQEWTPSVALDLNTRQKALEGDFHEVVLTLSGAEERRVGKGGGGGGREHGGKGKATRQGVGGGERLR